MGPIDPTNPYEAPLAELDHPIPAAGQSANLANAMAGRYDFTVGEVMDEAWRLVKGMKGTFWGAAIVVGLIYLVAETILTMGLGVFVTPPSGTIAEKVYSNVISSVIGALLTPLTMGVEMLCVRRALGQPISFGTAFSYFNRSGPAIVGALIGLLMEALGMAALIIPGIYLGVAYMLAIQLVCDQNLSGWRALETSRRAITHKWWSVFGLALLVGLLTGLSALGLLIPLIWTVPWAFMTTGVLYRRIFYAPTLADLDRAPAAGPPPAQPASPA